MSNIAEGFERGTLPELNRFLGFAKGSCGEVRSQLYEALDDKLVSFDEFKRLRDLAISTSELIGALKSATQNAYNPGQKIRVVEHCTLNVSRFS
jgi:four helix bundle protein